MEMISNEISPPEEGAITEIFAACRDELPSDHANVLLPFIVMSARFRPSATTECRTVQPDAAVIDELGEVPVLKLIVEALIVTGNAALILKTE